MVVPFDDQDIFATHNDKYGRGGFRVCDTLADRNAITIHRRKAGMWVKVLEDGQCYELGPGETNADWVEASQARTSVDRVTIDNSDWNEIDSFPLVDSFTWRVQVDDEVNRCRVSYFVASTHNGIGNPPTDVQWVIFGKMGYGSLHVLTELRLEGASSELLQLLVKTQPGFKVTVWRVQGVW